LTAGGGRGLPISATPHNTVPAPSSPWVAPGQFTVKLTAGGRALTQPLVVRMDPRVKTPPLVLAQQSTLSKKLYDSVRALQAADDDLRRIRGDVRSLEGRATGDVAQALADFDKQAAAIGGAPAGAGRGRGFGGGGGGRGVGIVAPLIPAARSPLRMRWRNGRR